MPAEATNAELKSLFGKPPKEVLEYFEKKVARGPKQHWDWTDTLRHSHDRAFTVSKATSLDLVKDIKAAMYAAMEKGLPYQQFAKSIIPTLQQKGWWGNGPQLNKATGQVAEVDIGHRRLRQIFDVNMKTSYDAGKHFKMMEAAEDMPYWRYRALPPGPNRRPDHQHLNNLVFRYDDPFWTSHKPRNGWGCQCDVEQLDKRLVERIYKRPVSEVVKSSSPDDFVTKTVVIQGKSITVTGFKSGSSVIYPDPGWDYSPGDFAWRSKQLLASKIRDLPNKEMRAAFHAQLRGTFKDDFALFVQVERDLKLSRGETIAVGVLDATITEKVNGATVILKGKKQSISLDTELLLAKDKDLAHALRTSKEEKEIAMPRELLGKLPDLLQTYTTIVEKNGGILFFSPPFSDQAKHGGKSWRWKIVFNLDNSSHGHHYNFSTATRVDASSINVIERME